MRPGGGGWILVNKFLQVVTKGEERLGEGTVFAAGDCAALAVQEVIRPPGKAAWLLMEETRNFQDAFQPLYPFFGG